MSERIASTANHSSHASRSEADNIDDPANDIGIWKVRPSRSHAKTDLSKKHKGSPFESEMVETGA